MSNNSGGSQRTSWISVGELILAGLGLLVTMAGVYVTFLSLRSDQGFQQTVATLVAVGPTTTPVEVTRVVIEEVLVTQPPEVVEVIITQPPEIVEVTVEVTRVVIPSATPTPMPSATPSALFQADFETTGLDWPLVSNTDGAVRISQGKLTVTANTESVVWSAAPSFEVGEDFYFQAQMSFLAGHPCDSLGGLAIGEPNGNYHSFVVGHICGTDDYVAFLDSSSVQFSTPIEGETILSTRSPARVFGLEAVDGLYTFYIDGQTIESFRIEERYGNHVGFLVWDTAGYSPNPTIAFDNVVVRESR